MLAQLRRQAAGARSVRFDRGLSRRSFKRIYRFSTEQQISASMFRMQFQLQWRHYFFPTFHLYFHASNKVRESRSFKNQDNFGQKNENRILNEYLIQRRGFIPQGDDNAEFLAVTA
jgi:hypothetical protein